MPTANEALQDAAVRHAIWLQRYGASQARQILELLDKADADLTAQLRARLEAIDRRGYDLGPQQTARLEKLLTEIRQQSRDLASAIRGDLTGNLTDLAKTEADLAARRLNDLIAPDGVDLNILRPAPELLRAAVTSDPFNGAILKDWVATWSDNRIARVEQQIQIGMVQSETTDQIIHRIRGTRALGYHDGVLDVSRRGAQALVRTAVNHVATRARDLLYQANDDIVKAVKWCSVLDNRTSAICRSLDGKIFPIDEGPRPPAHPNCRSTTAPVTKSWDELNQQNALTRGRGAATFRSLFEKQLRAKGFTSEQIKAIQANTRASMDGQVPRELTYGEWLSQQSAATQDDILGVTKGRLFRQGGLTVGQFVDQAGKELTLDQLRALHADAFEKAGVP